MFVGCFEIRMLLLNMCVLHMELSGLFICRGNFFAWGKFFSAWWWAEREKGAESIDGLWFTAGDHFPSICKCQLSENMLFLTLQ